MLRFVLLCLLLAFIVLLPSLTNAIIFLAFAPFAVIMGGQVWAALNPHLLHPRVVRRYPFVSIHLPVYAEPPSMVLETLQALDDLDYPRYEVIVLDNNTEDRTLWEPVRDFCTSRENFKFLHVDNLSGFKAGALNLCLELTNHRAELILTVDADYVVKRDGLKRAVSYLHSDLSYVQFPQSYRNRIGIGQEADYRLFFDVFCRYANRTKTVLPTGTLTLIRRQSLEKIGGWSTISLTEDAATGAIVLADGGKGVYVDEVIGTGLAPASVSNLRRQRHRWVIGNAQVIKGFPRHWKSWPIMLQMTAWLNPCTFLFACAGVSSLGWVWTKGIGYASLVISSVILVLVWCLWRYLIFRLVYSRKVAVSGWLAHMKTLGVGGSWLKLLCQSEWEFYRTEKGENEVKHNHTDIQSSLSDIHSRQSGSSAGLPL